MEKTQIRSKHALFTLLLPLLIVMTSCDQATSPAVNPDISLAGADFNLENASVSGEVASELAQVRRATAHFRDYHKALDAGYLETDDCVEIPLGGMGYHFVNPDLFVAPEELDVTQPQAILYEPQKNGNLRMIAVEYVVPGFILDSNGPAPVLLDQEFHWNPVLELWALHAWIWKNNPTGIFEDWNPKVTCDYAPEPETE